VASRTVAPVSRPTSFYYAFLVLPKAEREAIIAVWDFCRAVDDVVDEGGSATDRATLAAALDGWRQELACCYGGSPATPQGRALQPWVRHFDLSRQPFEDLIDGVAMDLGHARYADFDALYQYCWRVASTVGLICIEIFGQRSPGARDYAINLGLALQLTNILRDVGPDGQRGRIYLPLADLARFGCSEADLLAGKPTPAVRSLLAFEASRARDFYARAAAILRTLDARAFVAAEIMGRVYREILDRIERAGYDVFSSRIRVPRARRALLAADTWLRTRLGRHGRT
jgi:15-cis-phytoene synthase